MRIVHISDLHLRHHLPGSSSNPARLSRAMPALLSRAVGEIIDLEPDLFVLSGDLLDYPLEDLADPFLLTQGRRDLELIRGIVDVLPCAKAVVFGNHDHPALFRHVFGDFSPDLVSNGYRILSYCDAEAADHLPERSEPEWSRFCAALADHATPPQIHVQHYLIWPQRSRDYPHTYGKGETMRRDLAASGYVKLVLSGHYHRGVPPTFDKGVWFATIPAFCEAPFPYWVYELEGEDFAWTQHEISCSGAHV